MKKVVVVMSSYNGGSRIIRQLDSIFNQKYVEVACYVRDDGSTDDTRALLREYAAKQPALSFEFADNVGWQKSFLLALSNAPAGDYYAFSDQDDVWMPEKLSVSITTLEKHNNSLPLLFHCNRISCDENLNPNPTQAPKVPRPLSKENALTQEYAQGCSIVINKAARQLVCRHIPQENVPHDFWTGLICYYFGEIYYENNPLFYHINHQNNASQAGHIWSSQKHRIKLFFYSDGYPNISKDLLDNYNDLLTEEDRTLLKTGATAKSNFKSRLQLLFNPKFKRVNIQGTIFLKLAVLLNRY